MKFRSSLRVMAAVLAALAICGALAVWLRSAGKPAEKEAVTIYTSIEDYRIEYLQKRLEQTLPQYDVNVVFYSTGDHIAKLLREGTGTECDITHSLGYSYLQQLDAKGYLAPLPSTDKTIYDDHLLISDSFLPQERGSGAVIINTKLLKELGLKEPRSYKDLLDPKFRASSPCPAPKIPAPAICFTNPSSTPGGRKKLSPILTS